jgi:hypothetical protein
MIWKILIWMLSIVAIVYIVGIYPNAALVVMALGLTLIFSIFKDVS